MHLRVRVASIATACLVMGCSPTNSPPDNSRNGATERVRAIAGATAPVVIQSDRTPVAAPFQFVDVARSLGVRFCHFSPLTEQRHIHLFMGSGIGWIDFDHDGWQDLYCCQGAAFGSPTDDKHSSADSPSSLLFQNRGGSSFSDVTKEAGLHDNHYSMGIAAADYDNDGFVDVCLTGYGENRLLHNNGDGCFTHVELPLAEHPGRLSASCAWGDIDADGNLDLFVTHYAQLGPANYPTCTHTAGGVTIPISCHPANLQAVHDQLLRNTGSGAFEDISEMAGIVQGGPRASLGVIAADVDEDGDIDFYVANDTTPNQLWVNQGGGQFLDRGNESSTARNRHGEAGAGMGLVAGDILGSGRIDLFVTNYYGETNTLFRNDGNLLFTDVTEEVGLGAPSRLRLGFGISLTDFDGDSWLDLMVANGHVQDRLPEIGRNEPFAQLPLLFHSERGARFRDVAAGAGEYFRTPHVGRSTAVADYDHDGDADIAVNSLNEDVALLQNTTPVGGQWLRLELIGKESNRGGVGTLLWLDLGERVLVRCVHAGTGYLSCDAASMLIGLGQHDEVRTLNVAWPSGRRENWSSLQAGRSWRLVEGTGKHSGAAP